MTTPHSFHEPDLGVLRSKIVALRHLTRSIGQHLQPAVEQDLALRIEGLIAEIAVRESYFLNELLRCAEVFNSLAEEAMLRQPEQQQVPRQLQAADHLRALVARILAEEIQTHGHRGGIVTEAAYRRLIGADG